MAPTKSDHERPGPYLSRLRRGEQNGLNATVTANKFQGVPHDVGNSLFQFIAELYPICRSITGAGLRETLRRVQQRVPIQIHEVPTGTQVFDWTVPREWNIRDAYIKDLRGCRIIDFQQSNLHVLNYSVPINKRISLQELKEHLFTLPDYPDWVPYRTSYYHENWGFCLSENQLSQLKDPEYEVLIDSSLASGVLNYGELYVPGEVEDEILLSCHCCHPSLCNDNLSGVALATFLAQEVSARKRHYSFRFLFIPGSIGSITWLARNESLIGRIRHGVVLACVGDAGPFTYKRSRRGNAEVDRAFEYIIRNSGRAYKMIDFSPYGYDERQFCSPAFNLPVGCFSRSQHGTFPQYHTSADNLNFIEAGALGDSFSACIAAIDLLEKNRTYRNLLPKCEPQLGKRGLYRSMGGYSNAREFEMAMLWILNLSDGNHSLLDIAQRSGLSFSTVAESSDILVQHQLLSLA